MSKIKLVIFDMDGLIFNTEEIAYEAMTETIRAFDREFPIELYKKVIGFGKDSTEKVLQDYFGDDFPVGRLFQNFKVVFNDLIAEKGIEIKPGVDVLLDFLDANDFKKCIASSSSIATIEKYLQLANLTNRFDFYVSGEEVAHGKPAPDIFIEACNRAGETRNNTIVLEDSYNGLLAANRANIDCIMIPDMIEPNDECKQLAAHILPNLTEVISIIQK